MKEVVTDAVYHLLAANAFWRPFQNRRIKFFVDPEEPSNQHPGKTFQPGRPSSYGASPLHPQTKLAYQIIVNGPASFTPDIMHCETTAGRLQGYPSSVRFI